MTEAIKIFKPDTKEAKRLNAAAKLIEAETGKECKIEDILFDAGQNWMYTTILIESGMNMFPFMQALNPKQQSNIVYGTLDEFMQAVKEVIAK